MSNFALPGRAQSSGIAPALLILLALIALQTFIMTRPWGVMGLVVYYFMLLLTFRPNRLMHPNIFVLGYYFLWLVCPAVVDFVLESSEWNYILPWGRLWDWRSLQPYTLVQIQLSMTVVVVFIHYTVGKNQTTWFERIPDETRERMGRLPIPWILTLFTMALVYVFIDLSGGLSAWINNYSHTYLTGRKGLGPINLLIGVLGSFIVMMAGLRNYGKHGGLAGLLPYLPVILPLAYIGGLKSRLLLLLIIFFAPYLITRKARFEQLVRYLILFFVAFYVLTQLRTGGFYAGFGRYVEMITTYFNSYPLHDLIVVSRDPGFLETAGHVFVKPGQALGLIPGDADYDISVMLTKEYFPEQWYQFSATQQWPVETEMYLNFYGIVFQTIPMAIYAAYIGVLYRIAVLKGRMIFFAIFMLEAFRILATLRGVLIPWQAPILIVQYALLIGLSMYYLRRLRQ